MPETAAIEIPFSIIEPQLSLGRIAVSPAQFQAALPEEYRSLLKLEEAELPIALPLQEVLQNLPDESLQLRGDQEETEVTRNLRDAFQPKGRGGRRADEGLGRPDCETGRRAVAAGGAPVVAMTESRSRGRVWKSRLSPESPNPVDSDCAHRAAGRVRHRRRRSTRKRSSLTPAACRA